jgi:hypothetical protein
MTSQKKQETESAKHTVSHYAKEHMSPDSIAELRSKLPINLHYLSTLIARKPQEFTQEWATTVDEAFSLYTRTSTVNLILSSNDLLAEKGWPFPSFLNLRQDLRFIFTGKHFLLGPLLMCVLNNRTPETCEQRLSVAMRFLFWRHSNQIFKFWRSHHLLKGKEDIVDSIRITYNKGLFAACLPTLLGLLDFIMRTYFNTDRLNVSLQTLRNAFEKAAILPKHLKPGSGIWDLKEEQGTTILFPSIEQDLRLPGVFLSSFVEFGNSYYAWYSKEDFHHTVLNRHAIMHCATEYWTPGNVVKLLTFFDLTLRLERVLKIVIHGSAAYEESD